MEPNALRPYERSLITGEPLALDLCDGPPLSLEIERWLQPADAADRAVLSRAVGPALDVGCGPGRIVESLAESGVLALGIDIARTAVELARSRGLNVLRRDVFAPLPRERQWGSAILLDGNIGIGGDPARLLARVRSLLCPGGIALVETSHDDHADARLTVRFRREGHTIGPNFRWALLGRTELHRLADSLGFAVTQPLTAGGRSFTVLSAIGRRGRAADNAQWVEPGGATASPR